MCAVPSLTEDCFCQPCPRVSSWLSWFDRPACPDACTLILHIFSHENTYKCFENGHINTEIYLDFWIRLKKNRFEKVCSLIQMFWEETRRSFCLPAANSELCNTNWSWTTSNELLCLLNTSYYQIYKIWSGRLWKTWGSAITLTACLQVSECPQYVPVVIINALRRCVSNLENKGRVHLHTFTLC